MLRYHKHNTTPSERINCAIVGVEDSIEEVLSLGFSQHPSTDATNAIVEGFLVPTPDSAT